MMKKTLIILALLSISNNAIAADNKEIKGSDNQEIAINLENSEKNFVQDENYLKNPHLETFDQQNHLKVKEFIHNTDFKEFSKVIENTPLRDINFKVIGSELTNPIGITIKNTLLYILLSLF